MSALNDPKRASDKRGVEELRNYKRVGATTPFCLFDHLVGEGKHGGRDVEPNRLGGFEIEDQFKLGRQLYGRSRGFSPRKMRST